ncbi:MAG: hypothetical protein H6667_24275 [Ardenticatenaceae bacterium]|nr:hypothetical protein [Ardenticatenaceae bacterium]MCB9444912.1 hypothetical protein [Ardenticatenaceae bacterium]
MPKITFKALFQLIVFGAYLLIMSSTIVGCLRENDLSNRTSPIAEEQHYTTIPQNETVPSTKTITTIMPSPLPNLITISPTASNTPFPKTTEPIPEETPEIVPTSAFQIMKIYDFGGERAYDFWGERLIISPDSSRVAVITVNQEIGSDGIHEIWWEEVKLYDYETGQQEYMLQRTRTDSVVETFTAMAFSPDSQLLAVAGTGQTIWVWDVANGNQVSQISFWGPISDLAFSPDGQLVAVTSPSEHPKEMGVGVFDVNSGTLIAQIRDREAINVIFLENGKQLLIGAAEYYLPDREVGNALFIWNYETNEISGVLSQYGTPQVVAIDTKRELVATVLEKTLRLIDLQTLDEIDVEMPETGARVLSFDSAGNIWVLSFDGVLSQWDADGKHIRKQQFLNATDFAVIPKSGNLLISFPEEIWEVAFP